MLPTLRTPLESAMMLLGCGSSGGGIPALPAGLTNRWTAPSTGSDGDLIATLTDSIAGNNGTAAGSARPTLKTGANGLNGRNVLRFDGVANGYALGTAILPQNFTFVAVSKRIGTYSITFGGTDFYPALIIGANLVDFGNNRCFGAVGGHSESTANLGTGWTVVAAAWSGATHQNPFYANGGSQTFGSVIVYGNATGLSRIGKTAHLFGNCDIADMLLWQRALTSQELLDVSANLNATWGGVY
jgi:hypothetical protein